MLLHFGPCILIPNMSSDKKVDIFRDTPIRYLGTNDDVKLKLANTLVVIDSVFFKSTMVQDSLCGLDRHAP